jgi:hypothetical protein
MMNTMYTTGFNPAVSLLWPLHVLAMLAFLVGIIFLVSLALKTLTPKQLKMWGIWLTVIGALVCFLTIAFTGHRWIGQRGNYALFTSGMPMMRDFADDADNGAIGGMMNNGMGMSMNGMTMMLQGRTGDDFDEAFIRMMIPHHQGAIDMARLAQKNASHQEIKDMADAIISAQQNEIDMMKGWLEDWDY